MNYHRDRDYLEFERTFRNIFQKRVNLISRFAKGGRLLEVGCSTGVMLKLFRERGWQTLGVEPSRSALAAQKKGLKVWRQKFEDVRPPAGFFDLVILNHTLEHMEKPKGVLAKVNRILKSDGIVFVDVPNAGGLGAKILGKYWPYRLPQEHKWQFTRQSLASLLEETGFEILHWESRSGIFEYANPLFELDRKRFWFDILGSPYALLATLLNQGDSLSVIAKKD